MAKIRTCASQILYEEFSKGTEEFIFQVALLLDWSGTSGVIFSISGILAQSRQLVPILSLESGAPWTERC